MRHHELRQQAYGHSCVFDSHRPSGPGQPRELIWRFGIDFYSNLARGVNRQRTMKPILNLHGKAQTLRRLPRRPRRQDGEPVGPCRGCTAWTSLGMYGGSGAQSGRGAGRGRSPTCRHPLPVAPHRLDFAIRFSGTTTEPRMRSRLTRLPSPITDHQRLCHLLRQTKSLERAIGTYL